MNNFNNTSEVKVSDIMNGEKNVILLHDDKRYALTITRRGKLILTAAEEVTNPPFQLKVYTRINIFRVDEEHVPALCH